MYRVGYLQLGVMFKEAESERIHNGAVRPNSIVLLKSNLCVRLIANR